MNRRMIVVAATGLALVGGFAGQSMAAPDDSPKRICLSSSWDPESQGTEPLCVWIPGAAQQ